MIGWAAPGPYRVGFTTRSGGVSSGVYSSLNLGASGDEPDAVAENRRLACARLGLDHELLAVNVQRHTATVHRASPGGAPRVGDALWTDEPGVPLLALGADCAPIVIVTTSGRPAVAVVHAGWRGLVAGVVEAAVAALGGRASAAVVGPAIGPCCYEVGDDVSSRFDTDLTRAGMFDLWEAAARALQRAGVGPVEQLGRCTRCESDRFFSHRRSGSAYHGLQGVLAAVEQ
jgi:YfiH family protein